MSTDRISGGRPSHNESCPTCPNLQRDSGHPGWGWCTAPENRVYSAAWPQGFTPSQSPSGSCNLHPARAAELGRKS